MPTAREAAIDRLAQLAIVGIDAQTSTKSDDLLANRRAEIARLRKEIEALRQSFKGAVDEAKALPALFHKNPALAQSRGAARLLSAGIEFARTPGGLFDARFAKQMLGGN